MSEDLAVGSALVALTVLMHTAGLMGLADLTPRLARSLGFHNHRLGQAMVMTGSVLGIFALHTAEVWLWAFAYAAAGATHFFADALDLSTAMFSTVGYGDVHVAPAWRLLTALEGINGFILIGWSTAYLVAASTRHGPFRKGDHF